MPREKQTCTLSDSIEVLYRRISDSDQRKKSHPECFDAIVVGSGYGGALAALRLSEHLKTDGRALRIAILERGKAYEPGMFPGNVDELVRKIRVSATDDGQAIGNKEGLFDIRMGDGLTTVLANGLGGGSLINAGVMETPQQALFQKGWPKELSQDPSLMSYFEQCKALLGASNQGIDNTINDHKSHQETPLSKHITLKNLASSDDSQFRPAAITMAMSKHCNEQGIPLNACEMCGDCATGCNLNAKLSLDVNLLAQAKLNGVEIYTGVSVTKILKLNKQGLEWAVETRHTDDILHMREGQTIQLKAEHLIIAAGALGSTEILMRSETPSLRFSRALGQKFSSNGDMIVTGYAQRQPANAIAKENSSVYERNIGPTITGVIDYRPKTGSALTIEEMAIPAALSRFFGETITTLDNLSQLGAGDNTFHYAGNEFQDPASIDAQKLEHTSIYAVMGNDDAQGELYLPNNLNERSAEGALKVRWPELKDHPLFKDQMDGLRKLTETSKIGGKVIPNGMWQPLPDSLDYLTNGEKGPVLTVHPLGGCPMSDDVDQGVVDHYGRVFDPDNRSSSFYHEGLWVLDGSIIPTAIGTNPALTISALALRGVNQLCELHFKKRTNAKKTPKALSISRALPPEHLKLAPQVQPTKVIIRERLSGQLLVDGKIKVLELTLAFEPTALAAMTKSFSMQVDVSSSKLRLFDARTHGTILRTHHDRNDIEQELEQCAELVFSLQGSMDVMFREESTALKRRTQGAWSWWLNRGMRDTWQWAESTLKHKLKGTSSLPTGNDSNTTKQAGLWERIKSAWNLSSLAGEVRSFRYHLSLNQPLGGTQLTDQSGRRLKGASILGHKRFTYERKANPWKQLSELILTEVPAFGSEVQSNEKLSLDFNYLTRIKTPLLKFVEQDNQVQALLELFSLMMFLTRLSINIHLWSFRLPDNNSDVPIERFPIAIPKLGSPTIFEFQVDSDTTGNPVKIRLSRYGNALSTKPSIIMIHGYSVSGNTFTHPMVEPNLASYFHQRGWDVWVLDLRTSSAFESATQPWSFEDVAFTDIPIAVDFVYRETGYRNVQVLAHCMGAAMFSMAILASVERMNTISPKAEKSVTKRLKEARRTLANRIDKAAFSQVGPAPIFSGANIFRSYLTNYAIHFLQTQSYSFRGSDNPGLVEQLFDRLLYSLPYPEHEFQLENPLTPWSKRPFVRTRHRMDALYGRDFNLDRIEPKLYPYFDDLFGPLNLKTLSQVIQFSRNSFITDKHGQNDFVQTANINRFWNFDSMSIHGADNGLVYPSTGKRIESFLNTTTHKRHTSVIIEGYGHQDCLIGAEREQNTYTQFLEFFSASSDHARPSEDASASQNSNASNASNVMSVPENASLSLLPKTLKAKPSWLGPRLIERKPLEKKSTSDTAPPQYVEFCFSSDPLMKAPLLVVHQKVKRVNEQIEALVSPTADPIAWLQSVDIEDWGPSTDDELKQAWHIAKVHLSQNSVTSEQPDSLGVVTILIHSDNEPHLFKDQEAEEVKVLLNSFVSTIRKIKTEHAKTDENESNDNESNTELDALQSALLDLVSECVEEALTSNSTTGKTALEHTVFENRTFEQKVIWLRNPNPSGHNYASAFYLASCQYAPGILDQDLAYRSIDRLCAHLKDHYADAALIMGDQIYADANAGFFDPAFLHERYVQRYHQLYSHPSVVSLTRQLPLFTQLDDHEINDNLEPLAPELYALRKRTRERNDFFEYVSNLKRYKEQGIRAYRAFNPCNTKTDALYYEFKINESPAFMMDTRTRRSLKNSNTKISSILDADKQGKFEKSAQEQLIALKAFLSRYKHHEGPVFLIGPAAFLPRKKGISFETNAQTLMKADAWDGYPFSLYQLFAYLISETITNVVFLSGDDHLSSITRIVLSSGGDMPPITLHSIHSSALYSPFHFTNQKPEDYQKQDSWVVGASEYDIDKEYGFDVSCKTSSEYLPEDGFCYVAAQSNKEGWDLDISFIKQNESQGGEFSIHYRNDQQEPANRHTS